MQQKQMLALGDSYTIGEGISQANSWPVQLCRMVKGLGGSEPLIIAKTGWTTDDLLRAIGVSDLTPPYDLVSLLIGVNDQYDGLGLKNFLLGLEKLLQQAVRFAAGDPSHVIVLSIPDYSVTPFVGAMDRARIRGELDAFNEHKRTLATSAGVNFLDIVDLSRRAEDDPTLLATDGLHPSGKMYGMWAEHIAPLVEAILEG